MARIDRMAARPATGHEEMVQLTPVDDIGTAGSTRRMEGALLNGLNHEYVGVRAVGLRLPRP